MKRLLLFLVLINLAGLESRAMRQIPDTYLNCAVFVELDNREFGSGFFVNHTGTVYFVTARHVLFAPTTNKTVFKPKATAASLKWPSLWPNNPTNNLVEINLETLQAAGHARCHPTYDLAAIKVCILKGAGEKDWWPHGTNPRQYSGFNLTPYPELTKSFKDVLVGNDCYVFAYPQTIGLPESPQIDYSRPLLRKGIIAGSNAAARTLIIDSPIYQGNSGAPVLEVTMKGIGAWDCRIVGVVTEFVPYREHWRSVQFGYVNQTLSNSGYGVVASLDGLEDLFGN